MRNSLVGIVLLSIGCYEAKTDSPAQVGYNNAAPYSVPCEGGECGEGAPTPAQCPPPRQCPGVPECPVECPEPVMCPEPTVCADAGVADMYVPPPPTLDNERCYVPEGPACQVFEQVQSSFERVDGIHGCVEVTYTNNEGESESRLEHCCTHENLGRTIVGLDPDCQAAGYWNE